MVEALQAQSSASPMWRKLKDHIHAEGNQPLWIEDHHGIVAALRARNADAAYKLMARHLSKVADELMAGIERGEVPSGTV